MASTEAMQVTPTTAAEVSGSTLGMLRRADTLPTKRYNPLAAERGLPQSSHNPPHTLAYLRARSASDTRGRSISEEGSDPTPLPLRMLRKRTADDSVDWEEPDDLTSPKDPHSVFPKRDICICRPESKIPRPRNGERFLPAM
jgi:hypothetical protein